MNPLVRVLVLCATLAMGLVGFGFNLAFADSAASIQAMVTTDLARATFGSIQYFQTNGYYTAGDGGGGLTYVNAHTKVCTPDGGWTLQDLSGNCFKVQYPSATINILQWGGLANDSTTNVEAGGAKDNATNITNALTACKSLTLPNSTTKTGCTFLFPAAPAGKAYATSAVIDARDSPGINIVGQGPGVTMIKYIGTHTTSAVVTFGCNTCSLLVGPINSGQLNEITINANGLADMATNISGLAGGQMVNTHHENALVTDLNIESPNQIPNTDFSSQNVKLDGLTIDQDFNNSDWTGLRPVLNAKGIVFNDNTADQCTGPDICHWAQTGDTTGHTKSARHFQINNCLINADKVGIGILIGYVFDNSINCSVKQSSGSMRSKASYLVGNASNILCMPPIEYPIMSSVLQNASVSGTNIPANDYITVVGAAGADGCTGGRYSMTLHLATTGAVDTVTVDGTLPTIVGAMTTGTPNWDAPNGTPSGTSQWITFPNGQVPPTIRPGDTVVDLTTSANIPTITITGGDAKGNYVVACDPTCAAPTKVKLALPVLANVSDVIQFSTEHQSVALNDTPIGAGDNGPGQYNYFYNLQSGHGDFRIFNRYRPPMSYSFPNAGIQANNIVEHNGQQGGTKTVNMDPGAQIIIENGSGNTEGVAHIAEIHVVGTPGQDANSQVAVAKVQGSFNKGQMLPGITTTGFNDDTTPNECHWDYTLTREVCAAVNSTDGNLAITTGANIANGKGIPILSLSECNVNTTTPQYFNCSGSTGFVLVEVAAGSLVANNLQKIDTITITGAGGISFGDNSADGALCHADVTGSIKMLDATHFYMPNNKWSTLSNCAGSSGVMVACGTVGGVPSHPTAGSGCDGVLWDGTMSMQPVSAIATDGTTNCSGSTPCTKYTVFDTTQFAAGGTCAANGSGWGSDAALTTTIQSVPDGTHVILNVPYVSSAGTGFIVCQETNISTGLQNNNFSAASNFGKWQAVTGVTLGCSGAAVQLTKSTGVFARVQTGQQVTIAGASATLGINGAHPVTSVSDNVVTVSDITCLAGNTYSGNVQASFLDPVVHVQCSGSGARPTPSKIAGIEVWGLYADATKNCALSAKRSTTGQVIVISPLPTTTKTWDPTNIATATQTSTTQTVSNSLVGDFVDVSSAGDLLACHVWGVVTTNGTVTIYLSNLTGSDKDVASQDFYIRVRPRT